MLLHELFHALRMSQGLLQRRPVTRYDDLKEFYAVTISNMYVLKISLASAAGRTQDFAPP
jgi:hypothetical protein